MSGRLGTSDTEDGVFGSTKASDHVGVFGNNESTAKPPGGGAGGAGVFGLTSSPGAAGVFGANNSKYLRGRPPGGVGVQGDGPDAGVSGFSENGAGVRGFSNHANAVEGFAHDPNGNAILAIHDGTGAPDRNDGSPHGCGAVGVTTVPGASGLLGANNAGSGVGVQGNGPDAGVSGLSASGAGVRGHSNLKNGMEGFAHHPDGNGILAINDATAAGADDGTPHGCGVVGVTSVPGGSGVLGANTGSNGVGVQGNGPDAGVSGFSDKGVGVRGTGPEGGVTGFSDRGPGVRAQSNHASGIEAVTHIQDQSGIFGLNDSAGEVPEGINRPGGNGVWGHTKVEKGSGVVGSVEPGLTRAAGITGIGSLAGKFLGDVEVLGAARFHGDVEVYGGDVKLMGGDCAENFDVETPDVDPGTVMVIGQNGALRQSTEAYDKRVTGVISGAGSYRAAIILDSQVSLTPRKSIALFGKVYCKVDASFSSIEAGDLLTTSITAGHAMKATDAVKSFGTVIGKALQPWTHGRGLIPILIALQ